MDIDVDDESDYISNCNVCFLRFDDHHQRPKVLPCSHTFCLKCLQAIHKDRTLSCPICRAALSVTDVATLPNNIYAQHIIQLTEKLQSPQISMHWCFTCEVTAKPSCQEVGHHTADMSEEAKELQEKKKLSERNLKTAIEYRHQIDSRLKTTLTSLEAQVKDIRDQIKQNSHDLEGLEGVLNEGIQMSGVRQKIQARLEASEKARDLASKLDENWRCRSEALLWVQSNPGISWRQIAHLLNHQTQLSLAENRLSVRQISRSCLDESAQIRNKIVCSLFHPVKPILACAYKAGQIGLFAGKKHSSPFSAWETNVFLESEHSISSIDWNSIGNELVVGFRRGHILVLNFEKLKAKDYGVVVRNSRITHVRWNKKWAPDLFAACTKRCIVVFDVSKGEEVFRYASQHWEPIRDILWISADTFVSACYGSKILVLQISQPLPIRTLEHPERDFFSPLRWNPHLGKLAYCSSDPQVLMIWSVNDESSADEESSMSDSEEDDQLTQIKDYGVLCIDWYPVFSGEEVMNDMNEGALAGGTNEHLVVIWNLIREYSTIRLIGHTGEVSDVAFSPSGKYLASLSIGNELIIWLTTNWTKAVFVDGLSLESAIIWSPCCSKLVLFKTNDVEVRVIEFGS